MKTAVIVIVTVMALAGCTDEVSRHEAVYKYTCTESQMSKVQSETKFVMENYPQAEFLHHYGSAIMRNCELKGEK